MDYHGRASGVLRTIVKERPDAILINEGANTLDLARGIIDMYKPRKRLGRRHLGHHGHRHGLFDRRPRSRPASPCSRSKATAHSAFSGHGSRDHLPLPAAGLQSSSSTNDGILSRQPTSTSVSLGPRAHRVRQGLALRQDDGGRFGRRRRQCDGPRMNSSAPSTRAMDSGKPTLINAVLDPAGRPAKAAGIGNLNPQSKLKKK